MPQTPQIPPQRTLAAAPRIFRQPARRWCSRPATTKPFSSPKGFGKQSNSSKQRKPTQVQAEIPPVELLKRFHLSPNKEEVAEEYADNLTEQFFHTADAMLKIAQKEGNEMIQAEYMEILKAAMKVRQRSLRPEIRLLNELLQPSLSDSQRATKIRESAEIFSMNDGYFFTLLKGMLEDVRSRKDAPGQKELLADLESLQQQCLEQDKTRA